MDGFQDDYGLTGVVHRQFGTPGVLADGSTSYSCSSLMALARWLHIVCLENLIDGNVTDYPGLRRRRTKLTVSQIADIVLQSSRGRICITGKILIMENVQLQG